MCIQKAVADVEKAVAKALEKHYVNVLSPLKDNRRNKVLGNKYVKKLSNQTIETYSVPAEVTFFFGFEWLHTYMEFDLSYKSLI